MKIEFNNNPSFYLAMHSLPFIKSLDSFYPDIEHWYVNKVVPGVFTGDDKLILAIENKDIVGICLGKKSLYETKLRCVRVLPTYQNKGLGIRLIDSMLNELECDRPSLTVAEELFHDYSRLFHKRYGFTISDVNKGAYRKGKLEYFYN